MLGDWEKILISSVVRNKLISEDLMIRTLTEVYQEGIEEGIKIANNNYTLMRDAIKGS